MAKIKFHDFRSEMLGGKYNDELREMGLCQYTALAATKWMSSVCHKPKSDDGLPAFHLVALKAIKNTLTEKEVNDAIVDGANPITLRLTAVFALRHCIVPRESLNSVRQALKGMRADQIIYTACQKTLDNLPMPPEQIVDA